MSLIIKKVFRKTGLLLLFLAGFLLQLFLVFFFTVFLILQSGQIQSYLTGHIEDYLREQTGTVIEVERVFISFPKYVGVSGLYVEDMEGDTLVDLERIRVDLQFRSLLRKKIVISSVRIDRFSGNIERLSDDEHFNYSFLIESFSGESEKEKDDTKTAGSPWDFDIKRIMLKDVDFRYNDYATGFLSDINISNFKTSIKKLSFADGGDFDINAMSLHGADILIDISEMKPTPDTETTDPVLPYINLGVLDFGDINFSLKGSNKMDVDVNLGKARILPKDINLNKQEVSLKYLALEKGHLIYNPPLKTTDSIKPLKPDDISNEKNATGTGGWNVLADEISISGFKVDYNEPIPLEGFHKGIKLQGFKSKLNNIYYATDSIGAEISEFAFVQEGGVAVKEIKGALYAGKSLSIKDFSLITVESFLQADINADINLFSLKNLITDNPELNIHKLEGAIGEDLSLMIPLLNDYYYTQSGDKQVKFGLKAHGVLNDISIDTLWFTAEKFIAGRMIGNAKDILSADLINVKLDTFSLMASPGRVMAATMSGMQFPSGISLPANLMLSGHGAFGENKLNYGIKGITNIGWFHSSGDIAGFSKNELLNIDAKLGFNDIDLGYILNNDTLLGRTSGLVNIKGSWKSMDDSDLFFNVNIDEATLNNYVYNDFNASGTFVNNIATVNLSYNDEFLNFDLETILALHDNTRVKVSGDINRMFFKELNILDDDIRLTMKIDSDVLLTGDNWAEGDIGIYDSRIYRNMDIYIIDSLNFRSWTIGDEKNVSVSSDFIDIDFSGNINPIEAPSIITAHIFGLLREESAFIEQEYPSTSGKNFRLSAILKPTNLFTDILYTKIGEYQSITLEGSFDGDKSNLSVNMSCQHFHHDNIVLNNIDVWFLSSGRNLDFYVNLDEIIHNDVLFRNFSLEGSLAGKKLGYNLSFDDGNQKQLFNLAGEVFEEDKMWAVIISPDNLVMNYENWQIDKDNRILIGENLYLIENFNLSHNGQQLRFNTYENEGRLATLQLEIIDFDLENISGLLQEPGFVGGILSGYFDLHDFTGNMTFTAELDLMQFVFSGNKIGDINIRSHSSDDDEYSLYVKVDGYNNEMEVSGVYRAKEDMSLDFDVSFPVLDLKSFEGFFFGEVTDLSGLASGRFSIRGSPQNPDLDGLIEFQETSFMVNYLNAFISIKNETIYFRNNNILFENFKFADAGNNHSTITGSLNIKSIYDINYNLDITSDNFEVLDVPKGQNKYFYGRLLIDSDINVRGDVGNPVITGRLKLNQSSRFTYIVPQTSPEIIGREGVVEFWVPADTLLHVEDIMPEEKQTVPFKNIDISVNIEIDRASVLNIVLDEVAGDHLEIRGGGVLSLGINPAGEMTMAGRYDVVDGVYQMTFYDFIRKRFNIRSGSNIVWTGNPMKAQLDISAIYNTRVPVRDLMESRITTGQDIDSRMLNQIVPFNVILQMRGDLERPEISFRIDMPVEYQNVLNGAVYSRIQELNQNESELNKQVFSLLVFDRFMSDNLMALFGPGNGAATIARTSASNIMTQQLNRLSERYIQNVDITFDVESYQDFVSSDFSGRTELQLELTKDFFDERVIITVGGNIELEDHEGRQTNPSDFAGDMLVEYLLTEDGSLRLKGFRKNQYKDIFEGQVTETGISLLFTKNFTRFEDLIRRRESSEQITDDEE